MLLAVLLLLGDDTVKRSKDVQWNGDPPKPRGGTPTDKGLLPPVLGEVVDREPRMVLSGTSSVGG